MSRPALVFVNHSSHTPEEVDFVREVVEGLKADDVVVRVDFRDIEGGADWNREILEWIAECDVAVMLLRSGKLERNWIVRETALLMQRHFLEPDFTLLPYRLPGLEVKEVKKALGHLDLPRVQTNDVAQPSDVFTAVNKKITELRSGPGYATSPLERLTDLVAKLLSSITEETLDDLAGELDPNSTGPELGKKHRWRCAQTIARRAVRWEFGDLENLAGLINKLKSTELESERMAKILNLVLPFWVRGDAASRFVWATCQDKPRIAVALNGSYVGKFTANYYLQRANLCDSVWYMRSVSTFVDAGNIDELIEKICDVVIDRDAIDKGADNADVQTRINLSNQAVDDLNLPYFMLLPSLQNVYLSDDDLTQLRDKFPGIIFVVDTGPQLPTVNTFGSGLMFCTPELDLQIEKDARLQQKISEDVIKGTNIG